MENINVKIIYEDNHLLVVEKPPNIPTQEDSSEDLDMLTFLKNDLKIRYNKPGDAFLGLVHRLDRPVGGVMVFAKTSKAASRLSEQIRNRTFKKVYLAVVYGEFNNKEGQLINFLIKDKKTNIVHVVSTKVEGAKEAILDYCVLEKGNDMSLVKIFLHTGRPHQIRVQFSHIGHPLYGDQRYNKQKNQKQIALWSNNISFIHPISKELISFSSSPPTNYPWSIFKQDL